MTAGGLLLLSRVGASGTYVGDLLPGMLTTGVGIGVALVCVSAAVLTGAGDDDTGMLSGLSTTGHEIGGTLGVAVLVSIATSAAVGTSPQARAGAPCRTPLTAHPGRVAALMPSAAWRRSSTPPSMR